MAFGRYSFLAAVVMSVATVTCCSQGNAGNPFKDSQRWTLATADTRLVLGASPNGVRLFSLSNPQSKWNWAGSNCVLPLVRRADIRGASNRLEWAFLTGRMTREDSGAGEL